MDIMSGDRLISPHTRAQNYDTQDFPAPEPHTREGRFQDVSTARGSKFIPYPTPGRLIVRFKPADTCCFGQGGFKWDDRMPCCSDVPTHHDGALVALLRQLGGDSSVALWMKAKADLELALEGRCCEMGSILLCFSGVFLPLMCFLEGRRQKALTSWLDSVGRRTPLYSLHWAPSQSFRLSHTACRGPAGTKFMRSPRGSPLR